ncbi:CoA-transferase family III domain-containing protein [Hyaloraphidium curvatum]|nr:CoA-transferase family III domain-containing protein [Hyaloraphidium curvatum]
MASLGLQIASEVPAPTPQARLHAATRSVAKRVLGLFGAPASAIAAADQITLEGSADGPHLPSPFYCTEALAGVNLAIAAMLRAVGEARLGAIPPPAATSVNTEHATGMSHAHFTHEYDGKRYFEAQTMLQSGNSKGRDPFLYFNTIFVGHWKCKCGRWCIFYSMPSDTPEKILKAVGFPEDQIPKLKSMANSEDPAERVRFCELFGAKIAEWDALELQAHLTKVRSGTIGVPLRTSEFLESEHGKTASKWPTVHFFKHESPPRPLPSPPAALWPPVPFSKITDPSKSGVLSGIKVLAFTRVVAGPVGAVALSHFGPDIIRVSNPGVADQFLLSVPMNMNKRLYEIDARSPAGKETLMKLVLDCDVIMENNAYGVTDRLGFGPEDVMSLIAEKRPERGIVYCRSNAYGFDGPLKVAPGFEHVSQSLSGLTYEQGETSPYDRPLPDGEVIPTLVPTNLLDGTTGHLMALGAMVALYRRSVEGGSWIVQGSLLQTANFIQSLPRHEPAVVKELWKRYPPWPLHFDGASLSGTMNHYFKFMSDFIRDGTPSSHDPSMYVEFVPHTPYGVPVRTLGTPIKLAFSKTGPRFAPRPFGYDRVDDNWPEDPDETDLEDLGGGRFRWKGASGSTARL